MAKRKGIPWGPKNPLWRWKRKKAKTSNTKKATTSSNLVTVMPKKRRYKKYRKRRRDSRMPLSAIVGLGVSVVAPAAPGWEPALSAIKRGAWDFALQSFVRSWTGIAIGGIGGQSETSFDLAATLNPLNFNEAPAWKSMFWTGLSAKLVKRFTKQDPISKIPVINKFIKFS